MTAKLLLVLAITAILSTESQGTRNHILLFDGSGSLQHFVHLKTWSESELLYDWRFTDN
jgi:hypothetical protein